MWQGTKIFQYCPAEQVTILTRPASTFTYPLKAYAIKKRHPLII